MSRAEEKWWSPREIGFSIRQIKWLLRHWAIIRAGYWPIQPDGFFRVGKIKRKGRRWATFETPAEIWAELDQRMRLAGEDGAVLRDVFVLGISIEDVARHYNVDKKTIWGRIGAAFKKMQGRDRSSQLTGEE